MRNLLESTHTLEMSTKTRSSGRNLFGAGICLLVVVLVLDVVVIGRQPAWQDEIFFVSTSWSMARSQPPIMSVMAQYPRTDSPIEFYGPVWFESGAQLIRLFGLSAVAWRLACLAGSILTLLLSVVLVRHAGGDRWAQLLTALIVSLSGPSAAMLPGRWDGLTSALCLCGLLPFFRSVQVAGKALLWRAVLAGLFWGFALGSTPRSLTLILATLIAAFGAGALNRALRKGLLLASAVMLMTAVSVQTLLLLPWGLNSLSWYAYVKEATRGDSINATSIAGQGVLGLYAGFHKRAILVLFLLLLIGTFGAAAQRKWRPGERKVPFRVFLTLFGVANLLLMLLLLAHALGQTQYWLPPAVVAAMCWFDWELLKTKALRRIVAGLVGSGLLVLLLQNTRAVVSVLLTWSRRSNASLTTFARRTVEPGAAVYGPVSGFFYPVELAGANYLYLSEQARPGRFSEPYASISDKVEEEICARPTYAMWPVPDLLHQQEEEAMPEVLRNHLLIKAGELVQPPLAPWKEKLLDELGPMVPWEYGFPDVAIYRLKGLGNCRRD
jgi:hypothetical protein